MKFHFKILLDAYTVISPSHDESQIKVWDIRTPKNPISLLESIHSNTDKMTTTSGKGDMVTSLLYVSNLPGPMIIGRT